MLTRCKQLLRSSKPVVVISALVAVFGITGTAYSAKLITGRDVRDGSLTAADLSKTAKAALHGSKGLKGRAGVKGAAGTPGPQGAAGGLGETGAQGPVGLRGLTGVTGAASTIPGPEGPIGPGGTTEGATCTVPGPKTGTIHWSLVGGGTWSIACINVV